MAVRSSRARPAARRRAGFARRLAVLALATAALSGALLWWAHLIASGAGDDAAAALAENPRTAPVLVLAAPRVLRPGDTLAPERLARELDALGYRDPGTRPRAPGEYHRRPGGLLLYRRGYPGPNAPVEPAFAEVSFDGGRITALAGPRGALLPAFTCEPLAMGAFRGPQALERRPLPLAAFPQRLRNAVLAAEDARFFEHSGVDPRGIVRAAWSDLTSDGPLQGGSTITQQVVKNRLVGSERTIVRKLHEVLLAAEVERRIGKERILEIYLNEIYLGQRGSVSIVGMPAAALHYFGRDVRDLGLPQSAMLAALIASPGRFDPRAHPTEARGRRRWVLERMASLGMIDAAEAARAADAPLGVAPEAGTLDPGGDVLDAVRRELERRGVVPRPGAEPVYIHTSIDAEVQQAAREALDETLAELEQADRARRPLDGAVVVLTAGTGEIAALVGGRAGRAGTFNRALDAERQPGSAFKPFVALAAFADKGMVPAHLLEDAPLSIATAQGPWSPKNYDGEFRGTVTLRRALEESLNVPTVRLGLEVGSERVADTARAAGWTGRLTTGPSIALGTGETSPLALASAYVTLASLGTRIPAAAVRAVVRGDASADVPLVPPDPGGRVVPEADAYLVLDCMAGVVERGTGRALAPALRGVRVAAKTGTTQDDRDAWFVLVTGSAVVAAWVGRDDDRPTGLTGAIGALPVVRRLLERLDGGWILAPLPPPPAGLVEAEACPASGGAATPRCPSAVHELFREGDLPGPCPKHQGLFRRVIDTLAGRGGGEKRR